jgi:hypothetical protein
MSPAEALALPGCEESFFILGGEGILHAQGHPETNPD